MHPFLDTKSLTDDQILEKIMKARSYLSMQKNLGHDETVNNIQLTLDALELEYHERIYKTMQEQQKPNDKPIIIGKLDNEDR